MSGKESGRDLEQEKEEVWNRRNKRVETGVGFWNRRKRSRKKEGWSLEQEEVV